MARRSDCRKIRVFPPTPRNRQSRVLPREQLQRRRDARQTQGRTGRKGSNFFATRSECGNSSSDLDCRAGRTINATGRESKNGTGAQACPVGQACRLRFVLRTFFALLISQFTALWSRILLRTARLYGVGILAVTWLEKTLWTPLPSTDVTT